MSEPTNHEVLIGPKPFMNYVTRVVMEFTTQNAESVTIKARGKFVTKAVDTVEVVQKRFLQDKIEKEHIETDSEEFTNQEGKKVRVSTITIVLKKVSE